jgi:hypothetical protein
MEEQSRHPVSVESMTLELVAQRLSKVSTSRTTHRYKRDTLGVTCHALHSVEGKKILILHKILAGKRRINEERQ